MKYAISLELVQERGEEDKHRAILWELSEDDKVVKIANVAEAHDAYFAACYVTKHLSNHAYVGAVITNGKPFNNREWTIDWPDCISAAEAACAIYGA